MTLAGYGVRMHGGYVFHSFCRTGSYLFGEESLVIFGLWPLPTKRRSSFIWETEERYPGLLLMSITLSGVNKRGLSRTHF